MTDWMKNYYHTLYHYGVKGMKWGVRRSKEELARARGEILEVAKTEKPGIIKKTITGHNSSPKQSTPNSIIDHIGKDGKVDKRTFYDERGNKSKDIHTTNHGNPKRHPIVPHAHDYEWNDEMDKSEKTGRPLTERERKDNRDIL